MDAEFKLLQEVIKKVQESSPEEHMRFDVYQDEIYIVIPNADHYNITIKYNTIYLMDEHEDYNEVSIDQIAEYILFKK